jgi:hypothetical protein
MCQHHFVFERTSLFEHPKRYHLFQIKIQRSPDIPLCLYLQFSRKNLSEKEPELVKKALLLVKRACQTKTITCY